MSFEVIRPPGMPEPSGFSYAVMATGQRMLFIAGQTAQDAAGQIVGGPDMVRQFERVIENIAAILQAAGALPEHLVKMTIFVSDVGLYREQLRPIGRIYQQHFGRHYPAMTLVEVQKFFDREALIEIEAIAIVP